MRCCDCIAIDEGAQGAYARIPAECCAGRCFKLNSYNWLKDISSPCETYELVEVRFKNSRKEFFCNRDHLAIAEGDVVVVEAQTGYDVGIVSMTGELAKLQAKQKQLKTDGKSMGKICRHAGRKDIALWKEARSKEYKTMIKARQIAGANHLSMKICDVEYQGDLSKIIFYYTAEERVDFRDLIKQFAYEFKARIEMRQIGVRQEAGRIGAIGSCGREVCCSSWLTDFKSVSTGSARTQQLSLNPLKLAGQCGKLKCCINYELDQYMEAIKDFPKPSVKLKTEEGTAIFQKSDIFSKMIWYAYEKAPENYIPLSLQRVLEIIRMNKEGRKPQTLKDYSISARDKNGSFENSLVEGSITRFDAPRRKKHKKRRKKRKQK